MKSQRYAMLILPHLVQCAQRRETITFGELARRGDWHQRPLRYSLGYVRDTICRPRNLPLINSIVVTQDGTPGESFLPEGTAHLSRMEHWTEAQRLQEQVFDYSHWDALLEELELSPLENAE